MQLSYFLSIVRNTVLIIVVVISSVSGLIYWELESRVGLKTVQAQVLPNRISISWEDEVLRFADRLQDGYGLASGLAKKFSPWILEASHKQHISPDLVASLVFTESTFRINVKSVTGAIGPAQVLPTVWADFCGDIDLYNPVYNIQCGAQILVHYLEKCGDFNCALAMYNVGPTNLRRSQEFKDAGERYRNKISKNRDRLPDLL